MLHLLSQVLTPARERRVKHSLLMVAILTVLLPTWGAAQTLPRPDHIVIVVEENHSFGQIIGESDTPYINSLVKEGALLTKFFAFHHPSQPNYFVLFSGDRQKVQRDECLRDRPLVTARSLGGQLVRNGLSFKGYAEGLPKVGFVECKSGKYVRKHAPWISFADVPAVLSLPFSEFPTDFNKLPTVSLVIPDLDNDMHDGLLGTRRKKGDDWLRSNLADYAGWAQTHNSLLIITWDEDHMILPKNTRWPRNHIATILVGQMVQKGKRSEKEYNHVDLLKTIVEMYLLPQLPTTSTAKLIDDIWK
jgi:phosphatidylinositol-3-phosphatase